MPATPASRKPAAPLTAARGARTRLRLLEVAGGLFAAHGLERTTGQQICRRAGVNAAAIVYHFGGLVPLYHAALAEARRRLVTTDELAAAVAAEGDPRAQLAAFLGLIVRALASPASRSWPGRLFSRELLAPAAGARGRHAADPDLRRRSGILRAIAAKLSGLSPDDPALERACMSIMAPCAVLLLFDTHNLAKLFPGLTLSPATAPRIAAHLVEFAVGGLEAIAAARRNAAG